MPHPTGGYRLKDGTRVPGVTTIIGRFKDSGALLHWACEQGQRIERGEISHLYEARDKAGDAGTLAHGLVEKHINSEPIDPTIGLDNPAAWQAFQAYLKWESMTKVKVVAQEMEMVSEVHRFGGCPDAIGEIDGQLCLLDWKTSNSVYPDYLIQLAAYRALWEENHPDKPITGGFHLCRFSKDHADFSHHYWSELDAAWEQFLLFRRAYDIDKVIKKRAA
jgi:hypothetical protein